MCRFTLFLLLVASQSCWGAEENGVQWSGDIDLGYGYDSNVAIDDVDLNTSRGDQFLDLNLGGRVKLESKSGSSVSASISLDEKKYNSFDEFDGRLAIVSLTGEREFPGKTLSLAMRYIDYQLDHDGFLDIVQVSPAVSWFPSKKTFLRFAYEFSDESFDRSTGRDNEQHKVGVTGYYFMNGLQRYVTLRTQFSQDDADDRLFDNDTWEIRLSYEQKLKLLDEQTTLKLAYRYQKRDYEEAVNPSVGGFRRDKRHRYELEIEHPINKAATLSLKVSSSDYDSNLESADYSQETVELTLGYKL